MKLKGNTILYTLMISMIISTLLGGYLLVNHYQTLFINKSYHQELAWEHLLSNIENILISGISEHITFRKNIEIRPEPWGLFTLLHGKSKYGQETVTRTCLVGQGFSGNHWPSLYLADQKQALILCGKTSLSGRLMLPAAGIKSGYIGRRYFEGEKLYRGTVSQSNKANNPVLFNQNIPLFKILAEVQEAPEEAETFVMDRGEISHPWDSTPYLIQSPYSLEIGKVELSGKVLIISNGEVIIEPTADLTHTLIIAKRIHIKAGFQGIIQGYASEKILVESNCRLSYPSVLGLFSGKEEAKVFQVDDGTAIEGALIYDLEIFQGKKNRNDHLLINERAEVWGGIYATHNLDLRGAVFGQVITDNFVLKAGGTYYRNYLLDATINPSPLSSEFTGPLIYKGNNYRVIEWMEIRQPYE